MKQNWCPLIKDFCKEDICVCYEEKTGFCGHFGMPVKDEAMKEAV